MEITIAELVERYYHIFNDVYVHAFVGIIIFDILTGIGKAWVNKTMNSTINRRGLVEHFLVMVMCITVYPYLKYIGFDEVATTFLLFFTLGYVMSIIENLDALGVPFPQGLRRRLEKLKDTLDEKEDK